jgi:hypothetical protein
MTYINSYLSLYILYKYIYYYIYITEITFKYTDFKIYEQVF